MKWISVEDRLPEDNGEHHLVTGICEGEPVTQEAKYTGKWWSWHYQTLDPTWDEVEVFVTHWMPLPEPPK